MDHNKEQIKETLPPPRGGAETILVAEDENMLRVLARSILEELGYRVMLASDGEEAVRILAANREEIDLVILDLVMPRVGGREAYSRMRAMGSDVPVLFMTGYNAETAQSKLTEETGARFIQKPYTLDALARKLRETLDGRARID